MRKEDYYEVLDVSRDASPEEIKKAYQEKVKHLHPDHHQDDSEEVKKVLREAVEELNEAYEVLSDPEKRREYDEKINSQNEYNNNFTSSESEYGDYVSSEPSYERNLRQKKSFLGILSSILKPVFKILYWPMWLFSKLLTIGGVVAFGFSSLGLLGLFIGLVIIIVLLGLAVVSIVVSSLYASQIFFYLFLASLYIYIINMVENTKMRVLAYVLLSLLTFYLINRFATVYSHFPSEMGPTYLFGLGRATGLYVKIPLPDFIQRFLPTFFGFFSVLSSKPFYLDPHEANMISGVIGSCLFFVILLIKNRKRIISILPSLAISLVIIVLVASIYPLKVKGGITNKGAEIWYATIPKVESQGTYERRIFITEDNLILSNDQVISWFPLLFRLPEVDTNEPTEIYLGFNYGSLECVKLNFFPLTIIPKAWDLIGHINPGYMFEDSVRVFIQNGSIKSLILKDISYKKLNK